MQLQAESFNTPNGHEFVQGRRYRNDESALPDSWIQVNVGTIAEVCNGSTPSRSSPEYWNGDIPWVSSGEVRNNVVYATRERITQLGYDNSSVRLLPSGTVLLAMIGEGKTRGQSAVLEVPACINQNIAGIIPEPDFVDPKYLWYSFQAAYESNRQVGSGTGPQALNCQRVRELSISLPPLKEQVEIVRRLDAVFTLVRDSEEKLSDACETVDRLVPAVLAKAFRGELVPQDPADQPGSELIVRLQGEVTRFEEKKTPKKKVPV